MSAWYCWVPVMADLISGCPSGQVLATGFVEGEYVRIAPIASARLLSIPVRRGDRLAAGEPVAFQETRDAELAVAEARAANQKAEAQLANLREGRRPQEIAVIDASLQSARAQLLEARRKLVRLESLGKRGFATQSDAQDAATSLEMAQARVVQLDAELGVARLPARRAEIEAAQGARDQSKANLETAQWRLDQRVMKAPAAGVVADILLRTGEISGPAAPVVSFLPDGATKLKTWVPQHARASIAAGDQLQVRCDGCPADMTATVSFIAEEPEFTPPVIYSANSRQKLVYLVEALPGAGAQSLRPGQIVDVALSDAAR